jgi:hypothetical protein
VLLDGNQLQPSLIIISKEQTLPIDRQTDLDRQEGRLADKQADRPCGRKANRQIDRQTERQADRHTDRQVDT